MHEVLLKVGGGAASSTANETRLDKAERVLLLSDSSTHATHGLGLPATARAVSKADDDAAPATLRAIEDSCEG